MQRIVRMLALALIVTLALPGATQDADADPEACALAALEDVSLPGESEGILEALIALRDTLDAIIAECSGEQVLAIEADEGYPRIMYVSSRPGWINVRGAPGTDAAIVTTLTNRTPVEVYGVAQGESFLGSTRWLRVLVEGEQAWIHGLLLSASDPGPRPVFTAPQPAVSEAPLPAVSEAPQRGTGEEKCELIGVVSQGEECVFRFGWPVWGAPDVVRFPNCRTNRLRMTALGADWEYRGMCIEGDRVGVAWRHVGFPDS